MQTADSRPWRTRRGLSLERKLPLLVLTILAGVVAAMLALTYREMARSARQVAIDNLQRVTRELAASAEASTRLRGEQMRGLGKDDLVRRALAGEAITLSALRETIRRRVPGTDSVLPIMLWDPDGEPLSRPRELAAPEPIASDRLIPARDDSTRYGPLSASNGLVSFWVVSPVVDGGRRLGWIGEQRRVAATPEEEKRLRGILGLQTHLYFRNTGGTFWTTVAGTPVPPPVFDPGPDSLTTRQRPSVARGERFFAAESPIRGTPWSLALELPASAATSGPRAVGLRLGAIALIVLVLAGLVTWAISRRITRPLAELTLATESMARGERAAGVNEAHATRRDEIGRLAASFNRMVTDLTGARADLEHQLDESQSLSEALARTADAAQHAAVQVRASEERFRSLVEATTQVVWTTDATGTVDDMPGWRALTGQTIDEIRDGRWLDAVFADDRQRTSELWHRAVATRAPVSMQCRIRLATGEYRWFGVRAVPVFESRDVVREWVGTCTDIDDRVRQEAGARLLADASVALAQTLDIDAGLAAVAELTIANLADGCLVTLRDDGMSEHGSLRPEPFRQVAVTSRDPEKAALVREMDRRFPLPADARAGYPSVIRTGRSEMVDPRAFDERVLPGIARTPEHLALLHRLDLYSALVVPLVARGTVLGALTLVRHGPQRRALFDERDLALAEELGRRTGLAVENARFVREAQDARRFAELASQSKSEFLATMSHEIRTPINAIIGYTQLMEMGIAGPVTADQQHQLQRVTASGKHLLGVIDDILDFSKIEAGRLRVARSTATARPAVDTALSLIAPQATARGVHLTGACEGHPDVGYLGDEQRVQQILVNLLSNAVKFTPPGGRVRVLCGSGNEPSADVTASAHGPWTFFAVEDTGIGIAPDLLQRVFQPFVQAEAGYTRTQTGTGLGLAISRRLARLMGGDLTAESVPGEGSRFCLWLPAPDAAIPASVDARRSVGRPVAAAAAAALPPQPAGDPADGTLGRALLANIDVVLERFTAALRARAATFPNVRDVSDVQLQSHVAAWTAHLSQTLIMLESTCGDPSDLMRDSAEIQRVIAERHGAQRYRISWTEESLGAEFELLAEVIAQALPERVLPSPTEREMRAIIAGFIRRADQISRVGFRHAALLSSAAVR